MKKSRTLGVIVGGGFVVASLCTAPVALAAPTPVAYYKNCQAARDAGAAPIYRGEDGYRSALDRDDDGVACEQGSSRSTPPAPRQQTPPPRQQTPPPPKPAPKAPKPAPKPKPKAKPDPWGSVYLGS